MRKRNPQPIYVHKANIYKHQYEHSTRTDKGFCLANILCLIIDSKHSQKFGKIIKFSKYGALTYCKLSDPKLSSVSLYLKLFQKKNLFANPQFWLFCKIWKYLHIMILVIPNFHPQKTMGMYCSGLKEDVCKYKSNPMNSY